MAYKRPEGLSPCYYSLVSPDIPESHIFRWQPRNKQTKYEIKIYKPDRTTVLKTYAQNSSDTEVPVEQIGYTFVPGTDYYWSVQTWNGTTESELSIKSKFLYERCPQVDSIDWNFIPKQGDVVVSDTYFEEMKENIVTILDDYEDAPDSLYQSVDALFTNEVVPHRKDFVSLNQTIDFLSKQLEDSYSVDVLKPVTDSLGVSDLEIIRNHINMLAAVRPKPAEKLSITVGDPEMYEVYDLRSSNDGKKDPTMDLTWKVEAIPSYSGTFNMEKLSPSKDIRYYQVTYQYGPSNAPWTCTLFFHKGFIASGSKRTFDTDWDGLYTAETLGLAKQYVQIFAFDQRGNVSTPISATKIFGSNFKAPLGVKQYEVQMQKGKLGEKDPNPKGSWSNAYTGLKTSVTYKVTGGEGKVFFRVRAVDFSGLVTPWIYDNGVTFDPLTPPAAPKNFKCTAKTTTTLSFSWDASARAESYEFRAETNKANLYAGTGRTYKASGLKPNTKYDWFVRAKNRAGYSSWVSCVAATKSARKTTERQATKSKSFNNKYGGYWEDNAMVYQGEWCEIAGSPNRIYSVPVGWCWGKHKGMWIFDSAYWRDTLKGKKIIKTEIWLHRQGKAHGYYNDQIPTFWLHNYTSFPKGEPKFFSKHQPGKEFDLGEKAWVTLPNRYAEQIRDNKAKGIGIYRDNWGKLPYIKYHPTAKLRITYE